MATKTYTITQTWDDSSKSPDVFTFSLPDTKPADYTMAIELTNGTKTTATVSVDTQPRYYDISFGGSFEKLTFQTPYYKITKDMFSVEIHKEPAETLNGDAFIYAQITNNSLTKVTYKAYYQYSGNSNLVLAETGDVDIGKTTYANNLEYSSSIVAIAVYFYPYGNQYQNTHIYITKDEFINELNSPKDFSCTFYPYAGRIIASVENPNPVTVTAFLEVDGDDGNTYLVDNFTVEPYSVGEYEADLSSFPDGIAEINFEANNYVPSVYVTQSVEVLYELYPPVVTVSYSQNSNTINIDIASLNNVDVEFELTRTISYDVTTTGSVSANSSYSVSYKYNNTSKVSVVFKTDNVTSTETVVSRANFINLDADTTAG